MDAFLRLEFDDMSLEDALDSVAMTALAVQERVGINTAIVWLPRARLDGQFDHVAVGWMERDAWMRWLGDHVDADNARAHAHADADAPDEPAERTAFGSACQRAMSTANSDGMLIVPMSAADWDAVREATPPHVRAAMARMVECDRCLRSRDDCAHAALDAATCNDDASRAVLDAMTREPSEAFALAATARSLGRSAASVAPLSEWAAWRALALVHCFAAGGGSAMDVRVASTRDLSPDNAAARDAVDSALQARVLPVLLGSMQLGAFDRLAALFASAQCALWPASPMRWQFEIVQRVAENLVRWRGAPARPEAAATVAPARAFATLVTSEDFVVPAAALVHSLRIAGHAEPIVCIVPRQPLSDDAGDAGDAGPAMIGDEAQRTLERAGCRVQLVPYIRAHLRAAPAYRDTFNKLHVFALVAYARVIFLDADVVVTRNIAELFEYPAPAAVAWQPVEADTFNSGVLVVEPGMATFGALVSALHTDAYAERPGYAHGDQALLNAFFAGRWFELPYRYNFRFRGLLQHVEQVSPPHAHATRATPGAVRDALHAMASPDAAAAAAMAAPDELAATLGAIPRARDTDVAVLHFAGLDKPWDTARHGPRAASRAPLHLAWHMLAERAARRG